MNPPRPLDLFPLGCFCLHDRRRSLAPRPFGIDSLPSSRLVGPTRIRASPSVEPTGCVILDPTLITSWSQSRPANLGVTVWTFLWTMSGSWPIHICHSSDDRHSCDTLEVDTVWIRTVTSQPRHGQPSRHIINAGASSVTVATFRPRHSIPHRKHFPPFDRYPLGRAIHISLSQAA